VAGHDLDDLFVPVTTGTKWVNGCSTEERAWCERLADMIVERGKEPVWSKVQLKFKEDFPDVHAPVTSTLSTTIRGLVDERR